MRNVLSHKVIKKMGFLLGNGLKNAKILRGV